MRTTLTPEFDLTATGDFNVLQQGASGGNVPDLPLLHRPRDEPGTRIITLYRQNVTGKVQVGYGGGNFPTRRARLRLDAWNDIQAAALIIAGASSTVQVVLNSTTSRISCPTDDAPAWAPRQPPAARQRDGCPAVHARRRQHHGPDKQLGPAGEHRTAGSLGVGAAGADPDREPWGLERDAADRLHLPVGALRYERGELRERRHGRLLLHADERGRRKHDRRRRHRQQLGLLGHGPLGRNDGRVDELGSRALAHGRAGRDHDARLDKARTTAC